LELRENRSIPLKGRLSKSEYEHLAAFRHALRRFLSFSEEAARSLGIEPQQHQALLAVEGFPGRERVTLGELAEQLRIKPHSAVGLVNRLVEQGLMARKAGTEDKRESHVVLTPRGREILEKLSATHRDELKRLGPHLKTLLQRLAGPD
jgi:DNA-binding MarR family transcriptional regulator